MIWNCEALSRPALRDLGIGQRSGSWSKFLNLSCPPVDVDLDRSIASLTRVVEQALCSNVAFFATDGSAKEEVAAWAVYVPKLDSGVAGGVRGEDQSSVGAELEALIQLCGAILIGLDQPHTRCGHIVVAVDNKSAIGVADECCHAETTLLALRLVNAVRAIPQKVMCEIAWVPSRSKVVNGWMPWNGHADRLANSKGVASNSER